MSNSLGNGTLTPEAQLEIQNFVQQAISERELIILDGLQRTYTVLDCLSSVAENPEKLENLRKQPIRLELYVGLSKMGILYRMMTLNTGQTPMTFRHQIEILYHDYIDRTNLPDGITVIREVDERRSRGLGKYQYCDVVDMFYAYATGIPQSMSDGAEVSASISTATWWTCSTLMRRAFLSRLTARRS